MATCCTSMAASWLTSGNNLKSMYVGTPAVRQGCFLGFGIERRGLLGPDLRRTILWQEESMIYEVSPPMKTASSEENRKIPSFLRRGLINRRRASKTGRLLWEIPVQMNPKFLVRLASQRKIMLPGPFSRRTPVQRFLSWAVGKLQK